MGDVTLPTPGEVAQMREQHVAQMVDGRHYCLRCEVSAPCDAARLLALVDHEHRHGLAWVATVAERDARLDAVLAMVEEVERANGYGYRIGYTLSREQHAHDLDRIRRAATGEAT